VSSRGIDFVGYVFFHTHTLLRKSIKKRFARMLKKHINLQSIASYRGWALHCNSKNLLRKLLGETVQTV
jgi:RNA-directed DNA polymerase